MAQGWFTWDEGWGVTDGDGSVRLGLTPGSSETTTVYQAPRDQADASAAKDMVAWVDDANTTTTIMRWTKELGVGVLYQPPDYLARSGFAMSDDTIAWIGSHPKPDAWWADADKVVYWAPRKPQDIEPVKGPDLTNVVGSSNFAVGKDHAAFLGQTTPVISTQAFGLIVVQLSTSKKWFIPAPEGHMFVPLALSPTEVLVQELGPLPDKRLLNYRLYALDHLDALAGSWPTPVVP